MDSDEVETSQTPGTENSQSSGAENTRAPKTSVPQQQVTNTPGTDPSVIGRQQPEHSSMSLVLCKDSQNSQESVSHDSSSDGYGVYVKIVASTWLSA